MSDMETMERAFAERLNRYQQARNQALEGADNALAVLIEIARGDTGQSGICRRFLLGLYNANAWPFPLTDLRALDLELLQACLVVLRADAIGAWPEEIHEVSGNPGLFDTWAEESLEHDSEESS